MRLNLSSRTGYRQRGSNEDGQALPVVMAIVLVVVLLSVALITRVDGDFSNTNLETKTQQARALAQSGVADALFQMDQQGASPSSFCNEPGSGTVNVAGVTVTTGSTLATVASGGFPGVHSAEGVSGTGLAAGTTVRTVSGNALTLSQKATASGTVTLTFSICLSSIPGAPGAIYTARYNASTNAYTVWSKGTSKNISYAVKATVTNNPIISNAVVGGQVTFNGNEQNDLYVTDPYGNVVAGATAGIGVTEGGSLTCNGGGALNTIYVSYGGALGGGCTPNTSAGPVYYPEPPSSTCPASFKYPPYFHAHAPPTPCAPATALPCTSMSPAVSGSDAAGYTVTGGPGVTLEPGIYVCLGGLTMTGNVNVDYSSQTNGGRVEIYVFPTTPASASPNLNMTGASTVVNACEPPDGSGVTGGPCGTGVPVGDPTDLQIYVAGSGTATLADSQINGILWAPGMTLAPLHGSHNLNWTGAIILGTVTADGSVSFRINFDQRLETEFQVASWQISNYLETSPIFSIP
jgi:hypothetical protein